MSNHMDAASDAVIVAIVVVVVVAVCGLVWWLV